MKDSRQTSDLAVIQEGVYLFPPDRQLPTGTGALDRFVDGQVRIWSHEQIRLPTRLVGALWGLFALDLAVGIWMSAVATGKLLCTNHLCQMATLDEHQGLLSIAAVGCALALLLLAPFTGGLLRASGPTVVLLCLICAVSFVALIGIVSVVVLLASVFAVLIAVVLAVASSAA